MSQPTIRRNLLFAGSCVGITVFGIVIAMLGTVFGLPEMHDRLHIDLAQKGNLFLLLYFGVFLASVVVGPLIDAIGNKMILLLSSALVAVAMAGFALAHSLAGAAVASVALGIGGGGLNTSTSALVSDLYDDKRGAMLNALGIFFGVGALAVPLLAAALAGTFTIVQLLMFCAALSAACAVLFAFMTFPPPAAAQGFSWRDMLGVARYPGVMLLAMLLFCESGNEASIGGWTSTYVGAHDLPPRVATLVLAGYWAALMVGRLLAAKVLAHVGKLTVVLASAVGSIAGSVILLGAGSLVPLAAGVILIGLSYSAVFPTTLAVAGDAYRKMAGTVFGLLFSIALIGGMLFPWGVGQISQATGVRYGMVIPLAGAIGIFAISLYLRMREPTHAPADAAAK